MALNGQQLPFHHCRHLAHSMDMKDKPIDEALRTFQKLFLMPVSQVIVCPCVYMCVYATYIVYSVCACVWCVPVCVHVCVCVCAYVGIYMYMQVCIFILPVQYCTNGSIYVCGALCAFGQYAESVLCMFVL